MVKKSVKGSSDTILPPPLPSDASKQRRVKMFVKRTMIGDPIDTKILTFSRRDVHGRIYEPVASFADSDILLDAAPSFFRPLFSRDYTEDPKMPQYAECYGYDSDSDLDDEDEETPEEIEEFNNPVDVCEELVTGEDGSKNIQDDPLVASFKGHNASGRKLRVRPIQDVASRTWESFIHYLLWDEAPFAPLKSQGKAQLLAERVRHRKQSPEMPPLSSPKSMYRLADKMDLDGLKQLALNDMRKKLSENNILEELFSGFTARYPEVMKMEVEVFSNEIRKIF